MAYFFGQGDYALGGKVLGNAITIFSVRFHLDGALSGEILWEKLICGAPHRLQVFAGPD
jgi:hypothetical protein